MNQKIFNCPHCGKMIPKNAWSGNNQQEKVKCTACGSRRTYKAGMRHTNSGNIQRYFCRDCGLRFSNR